MRISKTILSTFAVCAALLAADPGPAIAGPGVLVCGSALPYGELDTSRIGRMQKQLSYLPVGERIATWAEAFLGTPYDTIPIGLYVDTGRVVCDSKVDCMYLVFRSAELATSETPEEAAKRALDLRFVTRGVLDDSGKVVNYDERFQYAEDMITSGKWGLEITRELGSTVEIKGSRGRDIIDVLPKGELLEPGNTKLLKDGDIIFFVKDPEKRVVGEVIGHLGIIKVDNGEVMLVHASGSKESRTRPGGGEVKKVSLLDYAREMGFIGVQVTRFEE